MKPTITKTTDRVIKNNLKMWFESATREDISSGLNWYKEAQDFASQLSKEYNISPYICATVISCLSPNNRWKRNKIDAETVIKAYIQNLGTDDVKVCTYDNNKLKAFKALEGKLIAESAPKTHSFAMNIGLLSPEHITIDKWHIRACLVKPHKDIQDVVETVTSVQYRRVERITSEIAKELNFKGYQLQAIIWVAIKNNWGR
jgi:hypothetical protein